MKNLVSLDNNYYLEMNNTKDSNAIDITNLKLRNIIGKKYILLNIDFSMINKQDYKKVLKKFLYIKKMSKIFKIKIGTLEKNEKIKIGYLINYDKENQQENEFINAINAILYETRYERYNYIYDTVCEYLDNFFYKENLCDFKNNKCGEKRNTSSTWGCCRHYKIKWLGPLTKWVICEHLQEDHSCDAKCISCKLYTCDYLKSKGIRFRIKDILLLNVFFNPLQKFFIKYMVYTPKEKIVKRLMRS